MPRPDRPAFVFVYNADSGLFNTVADIAHKVLSPETYSCNLCALTHGHFRVREEWTRFLESLDADCEFVHRDEFRNSYSLGGVEFPAILRKSGDELAVAIDAATLRNCDSLDTLKQLLQERVVNASA